MDIIDDAFRRLKEGDNTLKRIEAKAESLRRMSFAQWVTQMSLQFKIEPKDVVKKLRGTLNYLEGSEK